MAPVSVEKRELRPKSKSLVDATGRFRPSLRYLLSAWHLNQRVDNSPFSFLQEQELCRMAYSKQSAGTRLTHSAFRVLVYRFAARLNRTSTGHLQAWRNRGGRAGKKWLKSFLTRNPKVRSVLTVSTVENSVTQGPDPGSCPGSGSAETEIPRPDEQHRIKISDASLNGTEDRNDSQRPILTNGKLSTADETKRAVRDIADTKRPTLAEAKLQLFVV